MKKLNKKGFTIVELVIVIAVIAILAAVLIPTFSSVIANANKSSALQESKTALTNVTMSEQLLTDGGDLAQKTVYFVGSKYVCVCQKGGKMDANKTTDTLTDIETSAKALIKDKEGVVVYTREAVAKDAYGTATYRTNPDIPEGMVVIITADATADMSVLTPAE